MDSLFSEADAILNGGRTEASLSVKASFKTGCFKIEFATFQGIVTKLKDIFASESSSVIANAEAILGAIAGAFLLIKWLKKRKPTKIEPAGTKLQIFVDDKYVEIEKAALEIYRSYRIREAIDQIVRQPLERDGVDSFAIVKGGEVIANVQKADADSFALEKLEKVDLGETTRVTHLHLAPPSFHRGDKWRVNDGGGSSFYVSVEDEGFVGRVLRG